MKKLLLKEDEVKKINKGKFKLECKKCNGKTTKHKVKADGNPLNATVPPENKPGK
jgi:hypothetical protein